MIPNIVFQYFQWHYYEMSRDILRGYRNFLEFGLNYFSTPLLIRTIFSPWRRYQYDYGRRFDIGKWFEAFTFNLMSRGIGAVMRFILICIGIVAEFFIIVAGIIMFAGWLFVPALILFGFLIGFALIL